MFKEGDIVFIKETSEYAWQSEHTNNTIGKIIKSYLNTRKQQWYRVEFGNAYVNSYQKHDLVHAFTNNKSAAKALLKEDY